MPKSLARVKIFVLLIAALPALCWAAKEFSPPKPTPAKTYAAHDEHASEQVTAALDPYNTPEKANIFSVHYAEMGILPVYVVITNDGDQPVALAEMKAEMVTSDRTKLSPMTADDIYRRLSHPHAHTSTYPLPFPTKKVGGGVNEKTRNEIQNARFDARAVEPHDSQAGFFFFDISDLADPLSDSHLYLTGVRDAKGDELMYFDVPLKN